MKWRPSQAIVVLATLLLSVAQVYASDSPADDPAHAVFLVGGQWGAPAGVSGNVGVLFGPASSIRPGTSPDSSRRGVLVAGSAGVGGISIAVGGAALAREGRCLTTGFDGLLRITRTTGDPRNAAADTTYAGVEAGLVVMGVRLSVGVSHRIGGSSGSHDTIFTFGGGIQIPFGW